MNTYVTNLDLNKVFDRFIRWHMVSNMYGNTPCFTMARKI